MPAPSKTAAPRTEGPARLIQAITSITLSTALFPAIPPPARPLIEWAILQPIRRLHLRPRLFVVELLTSLVARRDLLFRAVAERDLFSRHEHHLPNRHAMRRGNRFARLKNVAELGIVHVPVGRAHQQALEWIRRPSRSRP